MIFFIIFFLYIFLCYLFTSGYISFTIIFYLFLVFIFIYLFIFNTFISLNFFKKKKNCFFLFVCNTIFSKGNMITIYGENNRKKKYLKFFHLFSEPIIAILLINNHALHIQKKNMKIIVTKYLHCVSEMQLIISLEKNKKCCWLRERIGCQ